MCVVGVDNGLVLSVNELELELGIILMCLGGENIKRNDIQRRAHSAPFIHPKNDTRQTVSLILAFDVESSICDSHHAD